MASAKQLEVIERHRKEKLKNEHRLINGIDHKFCNKHTVYFPEEDIWFPSTEEFFYHNEKNKSDYLYPYCKRCAGKHAYVNILDNYERFKGYYRKYTGGEKHRAYRKKNHEDMKSKGWFKKWSHDNPDKVRIYGNNHRDHDISENEWIANQEYFNYQCVYCGKTLEEQYIENGEQFHREHIECDGYNDVRNCAPACTNCNSSKHTKTMDELLETNYIPEFTQDMHDKIIQWSTEDYKKYIEDRPPYKIKKKRKDGLSTFFHQLWSVDEKRNLVECLATADKKKDLDTYIERLFPFVSNI